MYRIKSGKKSAKTCGGNLSALFRMNFVEEYYRYGLGNNNYEYENQNNENENNLTEEDVNVYEVNLNAIVNLLKQYPGNQKLPGNNFNLPAKEGGGTRYKRKIKKQRSRKSRKNLKLKSKNVKR